MFDALKSVFGMGPKVNYPEMMAKGAVIVDVRTRGEFAGGHVKGSLNIPLDELASQLGKLKKDKPVITCCASGMRSASAKAMLEQRGFTEVVNGGGWAQLNSQLK